MCKQIAKFDKIEVVYEIKRYYECNDVEILQLDIMYILDESGEEVTHYYIDETEKSEEDAIKADTLLNGVCFCF